LILVYVHNKAAKIGFVWCYKIETLKKTSRQNMELFKVSLPIFRKGRMVNQRYAVSIKK